MKIWFTSDWHWGHKGQERWRGLTEEQIFERTYTDYLSVVNPRDHVYFLGDICWDRTRLLAFHAMPGTKFLVRGNHDTLATKEYLTVFDEVYGLYKYKGFWISHAPIHPDELRGSKNLHGHTHLHNIANDKYFNCSLENLWKEFNHSLVNFDELRSL